MRDRACYIVVRRIERGMIIVLYGWLCGNRSIALISYIVKRRKKKVRAKKVAAGVKPPKPVPPPPETYIIPPDPAVVLGQRQPGERVIVEPKRRNKLVKHSKTMPGSQEEMGESSDAPDRTLVRSNTEPFSRNQQNADHRPLANGDLGH